MTKYDILKQYYGYECFNPGQEEVIDEILSGRDTMAIMPTGAGKSICYQIPALLFRGITLVISPLVSLMQDQVRALNEMGVYAAYLNSSLTFNQYKLALSYAKQGRFKIIYVAPERLETDGFLDFAMHADISMVSIDEAHCVSQWGQDFRPGYLKIAAFIHKLPIRPVVSAFTATATEKVREDIINFLDLRNPFEIITGYDRPNLYFEVRKPKDKEAEVLSYVLEHCHESGIIYCSTRKNVEQVHEKLVKAGVMATRYHAGLEDEERKTNQEDFIYDRCPVMVATNAFGMGIDKSNVRYVLHYNMPKNMENYYQEAGRAGRDGEKAQCVLFFAKKDIQTCQFFIENNNEESELTMAEIEEVRKADRVKLRQMTCYCYTQGCLRDYILHYFGEEQIHKCNNCSNCLDERKILDVTKEAQIILEAVLETNQRYGEKLIIEMLHGSSTEKVRKMHLEDTLAYGRLRTLSLERIRLILHQLEVEQYLFVSDGQFPILLKGERAEDLIQGKDKVEIRIDEKERNNRQESNPVKKAALHTTTGGRTQGNIFEILRKLRMKLARENKVPPYLIFSDKTLVEMCLKKPKTKEEMLTISGVGNIKFEKYGQYFLDVIRKYEGEM